MDKNERGIFSDIPVVTKNGILHSAILTTFSMDLLHFDKFLVNLLLRKKICSINVFADINQMAEAMEWVNPSFISKVGKKYSITNIEAHGAFHPKINFFVGDNAVMAIIGSGNLTVAGQGKNHETFTGFMIDQNDDSQRPLIEECWQYIMTIAKKGTDFDKQRIIHEIPEYCSMINKNVQVQPHMAHHIGDGLDAALLYNDESSGVLKQLTQIVPMDDVEKITIVSPFFDVQGTTLITLSQLCPKATVDVLLQNNCQMPPYRMENHDRISFYDFDNTSRGKRKFKSYGRQIHAKIFHFKTADNEYCLIGSANATVAGMGTLDCRGVNEEMCVLYIADNKDFLTALGIKHNKGEISVPNKEVNKNNQESPIINHLYKLYSAQYKDGCLELSGKNFFENEEIYIAVDNGEKSEYIIINEIKQDLLITNHNLKKNDSVCYLVDGEYNRVSNKVFINIINELQATNPSKESRSINNIISQIEAEGYNGLEIADILTDLMISMADHQDNIAQKEINPSSSNTKNDNESLPQAHYNPEYDNDIVPQRYSSNKERSSRLIDCIEESFKYKIKEIDQTLEQQIDEEENGKAETGYVREPQQIQKRTISDKDIKNIAKLSDSVLNKYIIFANKRLTQQEQYKNNMLTADDLNCFSISIFAALEICVLNRWNYHLEGMDNIIISSRQKQLYDNLDSSIIKNGANVFEKFVSFCEHSTVPTLNQFSKITLRTVKYAVLYGTLFFLTADTYQIEYLGEHIIKGTRKLFSILGTPTMEYLKAELMPISERYNNAFSMNRVEFFINKVVNH